MPKRRAHGDGGLFVRGKGTDRERWVGRLTLADGSRRDVYGNTQAEARKKLEEMKRTIALGLKPTSDRLSVAQFLTDWLENTARSSVRPSTFGSYEMLCRVHIMPRLGSIPLARLSPQDVQRFQNDMLLAPHHRAKGRAIASGTVLNARRVLGRALQQAAEWEMIPRNPVRQVHGPHVTRKEGRPLDAAQARGFMSLVAGDRLEALYTVALALGLRRGEALGLQWSDVDFDTAKLHVRRALVRVGSRVELQDVKTKQSRRTLSLPLFATRTLLKHRRRQQGEHEAAANLWVGGDYVFTTPFGEHLDPQGTTKLFQRKLEAAGLPHQRFHDLRHACASLLLLQGVDINVVKEILGHSTIVITANLYAHVLMGLKEQAAARMDALLGGPEADADDGAVVELRPTGTD